MAAKKKPADPAAKVPKSGNTGRGKPSGKTESVNAAQSGQPGSPPPSKKNR